MPHWIPQLVTLRGYSHDGWNRLRAGPHPRRDLTEPAEGPGAAATNPRRHRARAASPTPTA
jgi:hypothetical protein